MKRHKVCAISFTPQQNNVFMGETMLNDSLKKSLGACQEKQVNRKDGKITGKRELPAASMLTLSGKPLLLETTYS